MWPVDSPHKGPVTRKMFPFDDSIMASNCDSCVTVTIYGSVNHHDAHQNPLEPFPSYWPSVCWGSRPVYSPHRRSAIQICDVFVKRFNNKLPKQTLHEWNHRADTLKRKCHFDKMLVTGCTEVVKMPTSAATRQEKFSKIPRFCSKAPYRRSVDFYAFPWNPLEILLVTWWRHQMETFSAFLALCEGNPPVDSPHKGKWRGALMFFICVWTNGGANNRNAGDLRRHHAHYDVTVMQNS